MQQEHGNVHQTIQKQHTNTAAHRTLTQPLVKVKNTGRKKNAKIIWSSIQKDIVLGYSLAKCINDQNLLPSFKYQKM